MQMQKSPFLESGMGILLYHPDCLFSLDFLSTLVRGGLYDWSNQKLDYLAGSGTLLGLGSKSTRS